MISSMCICFSQTKGELCKEWEKRIDTITNLDKRLKICKNYLSKVDEDCKVNIYTFYASLLEEATKIDSAKYYYNKVVKLSNNSNTSEYLVTSYCRLSQIASDEGFVNKSYSLLKKAKAILIKEPENKGWVNYYDAQGTIASAKSDHYLANTYLDSIIIFLKHKKDTENIANIYHNKAINYGYAGDYEKAAINYLKAAEIKENAAHSPDLDVTYYSLGFTYAEMHRYELAKKYNTKSLKLARDNGDDFIVLVNYLMLASENRKLNNYDEALVATDSSLAIAKTLNLDIYKADSYAEKGWIYYEKHKDYSKAEDLFNKAYEIAKLTNNSETKIGVLEGLIEALIAREKYTSASKHLKVLEKMITEAKVPIYTSDLNKLYSKYYEKTGYSALAMKHLKRHYKIKDSIANNDILTKVADLEKKYETQKKELQIVTLNKEKEEQETITEKAKLKQKIFLIASIILLSLLFIGLWLFRELKQQQQKLAKAHNKLNEIDSVKNRLFSIIAHDLRGMLLPFQRSGKIVKYHLDEGNNIRAVEVAQEIEKNSDNLSNMLDNLLDWSLNQMDGYTLNPVNISLKEELQIIINGFEQQAKFKEINIELKHDKDENILIDKGAFHVIFRNLISNALKYTENGNIILSYKKDLNIINLEVNDSGIGMSDSQLSELFKLTDNKTTVGTQGEKGTGIGLNLVYRFVKMLKGDIKVSSEKRIGTRFEISIPILDAPKINTEEKGQSISA